MKGFAFAALASLGACQGDETVRAYGAANVIWTLNEINGTPFPATASLRFAEEGKITGKAPCNGYSATMTVPYPWFDVSDIASTRMASPDLRAETAFFAALEAATISEVSGRTLFLTNPDGLSMVFTAAD